MDTPHLNLISLCSGAGMLDIGVSAALASHGIRARTVAYCERESAPAACLRSRMEEAALEPAPIWCGNLEAFPAAGFHGLVDGIVAGFPCQPHSVAGKRQGRHDERNLLPAILAIAGTVGARFLFLENVAGLKKEFDYIAGILLQSGWGLEWGTLRAADAGASHRRDRWFCLAYRDHGAGGAQRQFEPWRWPDAGPDHRSVPGAEGGGVLADGPDSRRRANEPGRRKERGTAASGRRRQFLADSCGIPSQRRGAPGFMAETGQDGEGDDRPAQRNAADGGGAEFLANRAGPRCESTGQRADSLQGGGEFLPGEGGGQLGHTDQPRSQGRQLHTGEHPGELPAGPAGAELEHTEGNHERRHSLPGIHGKGQPAGGSGRDLADGHGPGCEWEGPAEPAGWQCDPVSAGAGLPVFAPGPDDPAWTSVLSRCPWLAPALPDVALQRLGDSLGSGHEMEAEPAVHRVADGLASILGTARADMLRIAGNGVVPQQAVHAFGQLIGRLLK